MIEKISVTNFKSHADTKIELGRVTALVGPNGCGKTSLLKAIHCLSEAVLHAWDGVFVGEKSPDILVRKEKKSFKIAASGSNIYQQDGIDADNFSWMTSIEMIGIGKWQAKARWEWIGEISPPTVLNSGQSIKEAAGSLETEIVDSIYFQASLEKLRKPSYPATLPLEIAFDGEGLASLLASLKTEDDTKFGEIESDLRAIVPSIKRVKARRVQMTLSEKKVVSVNETRISYSEPREVVGDELIFDTTSGNDIPAYAMSDGTLLALGIITLMHSPESPRLIMLDDAEQGLHPLAQRQLMATLKEFAEKYDKQILLTSHSPYIIDELEAKDVWVMTTDKEGISHCKRLSDHPNVDYALSVLTTGEMWGAEGEEWVLSNSSSVETANA